MTILELAREAEHAALCYSRDGHHLMAAVMFDQAAELCQAGGDRLTAAGCWDSAAAERRCVSAGFLGRSLRGVS